MRAATRARLAGLLAGAALLAPARADEPAAPPPRAPVPSEDYVPAGPSVDERLAAIQRRVQAVLVYPPIARARRLHGEARVTFEIAADGTPEGIRTATTSGHTSLDRAAERAVAKAAPLPWVYGRITVPVRFSLEE